jgi:hypothetical protein
MTIKELKQKIENLPDTMEVFVDERYTDFKYGLVNSANVTEIDFMEEPDGNPLSQDDVFVLSED